MVDLSHWQSAVGQILPVPSLTSQCSQNYAVLPLLLSPLLQGPEGSEVQLKVMPAAGGPPRTLTLRRTPLTINPVDSALCSGASALGSGGSATSSSGSGDQKLGYIRIATFSKQTADKASSLRRT